MSKGSLRCSKPDSLCIETGHIFFNIKSQYSDKKNIMFFGMHLVIIRVKLNIHL